MVYNRAYGVLACVAGRFPLKGNYTTKTAFPQPARKSKKAPGIKVLGLFSWLSPGGAPGVSPTSSPNRAAMGAAACRPLGRAGTMLHLRLRPGTAGDATLDRLARATAGWACANENP